MRLRHDLSRLREKTRQHRRLVTAVGVVALVAVACKPAVVETSTGTFDFESPTYTTGTIDGQHGWSSDGAAGNGCAVYDHEVDDVAASGTEPSAFGFGDQSLRMSDAVTSGCFGDQTFTPPTDDEAGETTASNNGLHTGGTRHGFYEASWSFADAGNPLAVQSGLHVVASPDRGDGARMSWVEMQDCSATIGAGDECQNGAGLEVNFFEYDTTVDDFVFHNVVSNLARDESHTVLLRMWFFEGADNDVVQVCVDGTNCLTGNSWEDFFRDGANCDPACPEAVPTVDKLLFRTGGDADPGNAGNGFFIDNLEVRTANYTGAAFSVSGPSQVLEGQSGTANADYTVTLSEALPFTTTVNYTTAPGTATAGTDYTTTSGTLTFPAGTTTQPIAVPIKGDTTDEPYETFNVNLSNSKSIGGAPGAESFPKYAAIDVGSKTTTIQNDDGTLRITDSSVAEGDSGLTPMPFTITLDHPVAVTVTVHAQTFDGTAHKAVDYKGVNTTVTFVPGTVSRTLNVNVIGDTVPESNKNFTVTLSSPTNATIAQGTATGVITDDD